MKITVQEIKKLCKDAGAILRRQEMLDSDLVQFMQPLEEFGQASYFLHVAFYYLKDSMRFQNGVIAKLERAIAEMEEEEEQ